MVQKTVSLWPPTGSVSSHEASDSGPGAAAGRQGPIAGREHWTHNEQEQGHMDLLPYLHLSWSLTYSDLQSMVASLLPPKAHATSLLPKSARPHREGHSEKYSFQPKFTIQQF